MKRLTRKPQRLRREMSDAARRFAAASELISGAVSKRHRAFGMRPRVATRIAGVGKDTVYDCFRRIFPRHFAA